MMLYITLLRDSTWLALLHRLRGCVAHAASPSATGGPGVMRRGGTLAQSLRQPLDAGLRNRQHVVLQDVVDVGAHGRQHIHRCA